MNKFNFLLVFFILLYSLLSYSAPQKKSGKRESISNLAVEPSENEKHEIQRKIQGENYSILVGFKESVELECYYNDSKDFKYSSFKNIKLKNNEELTKGIETALPGDCKAKEAIIHCVKDMKDNEKFFDGSIFSVHNFNDVIGFFVRGEETKSISLPQMFIEESGDGYKIDLKLSAKKIDERTVTGLGLSLWINEVDNERKLKASCGLGGQIEIAILNQEKLGDNIDESFYTCPKEGKTYDSYGIDNFLNLTYLTLNKEKFYPQNHLLIKLAINDIYDTIETMGRQKAMELNRKEVDAFRIEQKMSEHIIEKGFVTSEARKMNKGNSGNEATPPCYDPTKIGTPWDVEKEKRKAFE